MDTSAFRSFASLGFGHITAPGAIDHIMFLLALAAVYTWRDWRPALVVVTAFTVGHSTTLAVALLSPEWLPPSRFVEFLIPVTIVAMGVENLVRQRTAGPQRHSWRRPALAGSFGLIHGAGFAGYLSDLLPGSIGVPLLGFNVGLEVGQALVLAVAIGSLALIDRVMSMLAIRQGRAFQLRVAGVSVLVVLLGGLWAAERVPW